MVDDALIEKLNTDVRTGVAAVQVFQQVRQSGGEVAVERLWQRWRSEPSSMWISVMQAEVAIYRNQLAHALQILTTAFTEEPNNRVVLHALATCFHRLGRLDDAIDIAMRWTELHPDDVTAWFCLAYYTMARGQSENSAIFWEQALACDPDPEVSSSILVNLYIARGRCGKPGLDVLERLPDEVLVRCHRTYGIPMALSPDPGPSAVRGSAH